MKDREQNISALSKMGRGIAMVGLFLGGCAPSIAELRREPKLHTSSTLQTDHYRIERVSPHVFRVAGNTNWKWQLESSLQAGEQFLEKQCSIEYKIESGRNEYFVIVANDDCLPEVK